MFPTKFPTNLAKGYHKLNCDTCQKETWHYKPDLGEIRCCVHVGNITTGNAKPVKDLQYIAVEPTSKFKVAPEGIQKKPVENFDKKGWHGRFCEICNRQTWWYKGPDQEPVHCTYHSAWIKGVKHAVVEKESNHVQVLAQFSPVFVTPTEQELRIANKMDRKLWANSEAKHKSEVSVTDQEWAKDLFGDVITEVKDPDKLYCSFCGNETPYAQTTSENRPKMRFVQDIFTNSDGEPCVREKAVVISEKVNACRNCCLEIRKPVTVRVV